MSATYTWDVFTSLDGFGSYNENGDWGGYWASKDRNFLEHRLRVYQPPQRFIFGANTFREFVEMLGSGDPETGVLYPWVAEVQAAHDRHFDVADSDDRLAERNRCRR